LFCTSLSDIGRSLDNEDKNKKAAIVVAVVVAVVVGVLIEVGIYYINDFKLFNCEISNA